MEKILYLIDVLFVFYLIFSIGRLIKYHKIKVMRKHIQYMFSTSASDLLTREMRDANTNDLSECEWELLKEIYNDMRNEYAVKFTLDKLSEDKKYVKMHSRLYVLYSLYLCINTYINKGYYFDTKGMTIYNYNQTTNSHSLTEDGIKVYTILYTIALCCEHHNLFDSSISSNIKKTLDSK